MAAGTVPTFNAISARFILKQIFPHHDSPARKNIPKRQGTISSDLIKINRSGAVFETQLERKRLVERYDSSLLRLHACMLYFYDLLKLYLVDLEHRQRTPPALSTVDLTTLCDILQYTGSSHDRARPEDAGFHTVCGGLLPTSPNCPAGDRHRQLSKRFATVKLNEVKH